MAACINNIDQQLVQCYVWVAKHAIQPYQADIRQAVPQLADSTFFIANSRLSRSCFRHDLTLLLSPD